MFIYLKYNDLNLQPLFLHSTFYCPPWAEVRTPLPQAFLWLETYQLSSVVFLYGFLYGYMGYLVICLILIGTAGS